ncbi:hypothetical protein BDV29DRAFT_148633 [Aspergillus leporis]|jgi:hypothetical protein|uniref:Uncharacterized protein n=1 Tax=Aspergillus leporis TaxID=41062 RepID=A0A5N5WY13_9EURO|nr:hypothetical protein BDV29DRAFT_148633 [Aspergillus leporis]
MSESMLDDGIRNLFFVLVSTVTIARGVVLKMTSGRIIAKTTASTNIPSKSRSGENEVHHNCFAL